MSVSNRVQAICPASLLKKIEGRRAIWIHAASVGEIVATSPLVKEVKKGIS